MRCAPCIILQGMLGDPTGAESDGENGYLSSPGATKHHTPAGAATSRAAGCDGVMVQELGGPCGLWSLEEADLAREALLALQVGGESVGNVNVAPSRCV
jgi:hypothetical protein